MNVQLADTGGAEEERWQERPEQEAVWDRVTEVEMFIMSRGFAGVQLPHTLDGHWVVGARLISMGRPQGLD